ncbi:MAG: hypothetical protein IKI31_03370, partial [Treponema sp.]|nr:hypothetical protein [Treponema sp.]
LIKKTTELAKKTEALKHAYRDAEEGEKNYQKLEQLKSQKNYFEELSCTISNAERAKNLREFIAKYDTAKKHLEVAKNKFENSSKEKINFIEKFSTLENQKDEMQKLKTQNENDERESKNLFEKIKKCEELNKLKIENDSVQKEKQTNENEINKLLEQKKSLETFLEGKTIAEIINEVSQSIQNLTEEKNKLATEKDDCKKRDDFTQKLEETNNLLNEAEENYTREQKKLERLQQTLKQNEACEFSLSLKDGEPCPVCDSLSHPHPAHKDAKLLNYSEQIITTKESIDSVQKLAQKYHDDCVALQKEKKLCEENLAAISTKKSFAEIENAYNNTIEKIIQNENKNKQILQVNNELQKLEKHINETNELFEKRNRLHAENLGRIQEIEKTLGSPPETLQEKESNLRLQLEKNRDTFTRWETNYNETKTNLARAEESFSKDEQNVESWKNQFYEASRELNEKISFLNFNSIEEAKSFDLEDAELEKKRKEQNQFNEELKSAEDAVNVWKNKKLKSLTQITSELEETNEQEDALTNERDEVRNILNQKQAALTEYESDFKRFRNEQNKKITLEKELAPLRELNSNLSGNNKQKLQLESWALGMYFEQVVDFASRRFNDISNGRFFFKLKPTEDAPSGNKFRGLDLLVLDTHTGKTSDTAELSGGETFEASISLALAITDVVQNNNGGGIQLDSLFIDEGFGTLDSETLDKAMTVLTELAETKMIGMISHVSEMENYTGINSSIIVNKNTSGSTITIS